MKKTENILDKKRDELIEELVSNGVFKIDGKQLYELPIQLLMNESQTVEQTEL